VPWLSTPDDTIRVAAGDKATTRVRLDASGLKPGVYRATPLIDTTDPGAPQARVPVQLTVTDGR
jgi:hypothetical protein